MFYPNFCCVFKFFVYFYSPRHARNGLVLVGPAHDVGLVSGEDAAAGHALALLGRLGHDGLGRFEVGRDVLLPLQRPPLGPRGGQDEL